MSRPAALRLTGAPQLNRPGESDQAMSAKRGSDRLFCAAFSDGLAPDVHEQPVLEADATTPDAPAGFTAGGRALPSAGIGECRSARHGSRVTCMQTRGGRPSPTPAALRGSSAPMEE
jgi:hypothetical protein